MEYVDIFFAGAFLCNAIPHVVSGLQGLPFPTPFAKPSGIGYSSPLVNFLWGSLNFIIGLYLLFQHAIVIGFNLDFIVLVVGALIMGVFSALRFGKVRRDHEAGRL